MKIELPYGRGKVVTDIPDDRLEALLVSRVEDFNTDRSQGEIVRQALNSPLASKPLKELVKGKNQVVIISSDHTRPVPSRITMPVLLEEINKGNPEAVITILVATGFHRPSTDRELEDKYGREIVNKVKIVNHDSRDKKQMIKIGSLPSGGELIINKLALEADLLIAEGFIEPHFFAGFSGGRKSILPGIASRETVLANHCSDFIAHKRARTGILEGNPLHEDMLYAAERVNLSFILNVVLNGEKRIINAFAGDREKAHEKGCSFLASLAGVEKKEADIVVTSNGGYPLDQNIYQAVKSMTAAEACCRENGVIIVLAECSDGHGGESFYQTFARADSVQGIMEEILARTAEETVADQWESQVLARILLKHEVILVSEVERELVENMYLHYAKDINTALKMAEKIAGKKSKITVIPDGVGVIV